jgi:F420H(2)-dependent quinone reductase
MATQALPGWLPAANRLVRFLQRMGLRLGTIHVLTVPGRVSGAPRPTPVSPLTVDGRSYVVAALPQADWARNARAAGAGVLAYGRQQRRVTLTEIVRGSDPDEFAAVADRVAVFELRDA